MPYVAGLLAFLALLVPAPVLSQAPPIEDELVLQTPVSKFVVDADDKRTARLNLIAHLLSLVPYQHVPRKQIKLPPRQKRKYERPPRDWTNTVPDYAGELMRRHEAEG